MKNRILSVLLRGVIALMVVFEGSVLGLRTIHHSAPPHQYAGDPFNPIDEPIKCNSQSYPTGCEQYVDVTQLTPILRYDALDCVVEEHNCPRNGCPVAYCHLESQNVRPTNAYAIQSLVNMGMVQCSPGGDSNDNGKTHCEGQVSKGGVYSGCINHPGIAFCGVNNQVVPVENAQNYIRGLNPIDCTHDSTLCEAYLSNQNGVYALECPSGQPNAYCTSKQTGSIIGSTGRVPVSQYKVLTNQSSPQDYGDANTIIQCSPANNPTGCQGYVLQSNRHSLSCEQSSNCRNDQNQGNVCYCQDAEDPNHSIAVGPFKQT